MTTQLAVSSLETAQTRAAPFGGLIMPLIDPPVCNGSDEEMKNNERKIEISNSILFAMVLSIS